MTALLTVDIELLSLAILAFICANTLRRAEHGQLQHRLFLALACVLIVLLAADVVSRLVNGREGDAYRCLNWISNLLLFLLDPVVVIAWTLYADYQVNRDAARLKRLLLPLGLLAGLNAAAGLASTATGWFMSVGPGNLYVRGPYVACHYLLCYLPILYTAVYILKNRKRLEKGQFAVLMFYAVPAAVGGILQYFIYGLALVWSGMTLSVLLIYIGIQDRRLDTDYLTGACNRRMLDRALVDRVRMSAAGQTFSAILIDLDGFKAINDTLGHAAGDDALQTAVRLMRGCLRGNDFLARYGGDEFMILLRIADLPTLEETVERIRRCFEGFNGTGEKPYRLRFSTGYAVFDAGIHGDAAGFMRHADRLMYEDKLKESAGLSGPLPPSHKGIAE